MKFKIAKPEDFPDVEEFAFKLSKAYSVVYSDLLTVLLQVNSAVMIYEQSEQGLRDTAWFLDFLKRTIKEFEDTEETIQK